MEGFLVYMQLTEEQLNKIKNKLNANEEDIFKSKKDFIIKKTKSQFNQITSSTGTNTIKSINKNIEELKEVKVTSSYLPKHPNDTFWRFEIKFDNNTVFYLTYEYEEQEKLDTRKSETKYFNKLKDIIENSLSDAKNNNSSLNIQIIQTNNLGRGKLLKDVISVQQIPGNRKEDFIIKCKEKNYKISHKSGKSASDFLQYGGISKLSNDDFIKEYLKDIFKLSEDAKKEISGNDYFDENQILRKGIYIYRKITNINSIEMQNLLKKAIYGNDTPVNAFAQGEFKVIEIDKDNNNKIYTLQLTTNHILVEHPNVNFLQDIPGYEPIIVTEQKETNQNRKTNFIDGTQKSFNGRTNIYPLAYVNSRNENKRKEV